MRADLIRPAEVDVLCGDATKARDFLGWTPTISFGDMVTEMVRLICDSTARETAPSDGRILKEHDYDA